MAYKLNKFATLCQEEEVVDIDINMEPNEDAIAAEIDANEVVAEISDASDQMDNAIVASGEIEDKIEEGEAVVAVSEPAVDNGGDVPADVVVTTDSGKELTEDEVAEASEKLSDNGEVSPEAVVEQEAFIQKIEMITGISARSHRVSLEDARRNSTLSYKMNLESLSSIWESVKEFVKKIWNWIKTQFNKFKDFIMKYLPTKVSKAKRLMEALKEKKTATVNLKKLGNIDLVAFATLGVDFTEGYKAYGNAGEALSKANEAIIKSVEEAAKIANDTSKDVSARKDAVNNIRNSKAAVGNKISFSFPKSMVLPSVNLLDELNKLDEFKGDDKKLQVGDYIVVGASNIASISDDKFKFSYEVFAKASDGKTQNVTVEVEAAVDDKDITGETAYKALDNLVTASVLLGKAKEHIIGSADKAFSAIEKALGNIKGGDTSNGDNSKYNALGKEIAAYNREAAKATKDQTIAYIKLVNTCASKTLNAWIQIANAILK